MKIRQLVEAAATAARIQKQMENSFEGEEQAVEVALELVQQAPDELANREALASAGFRVYGSGENAIYRIAPSTMPR